MKVKVYRNLNRKGFVYSVLSPKTGKVVDRTEVLYLRNCDMKVSEAGHKRVLKEGRKNVHAFIIGERLKRKPTFKGYNCYEIKYNPYFANHFFVYDKNKSLKEQLQINIFWADYVSIENGVVKAWYKSFKTREAFEAYFGV